MEYDSEDHWREAFDIHWHEERCESLGEFGQCEEVKYHSDKHKAKQDEIFTNYWHNEFG